MGLIVYVRVEVVVTLHARRRRGGLYRSRDSFNSGRSLPFIS